MAEYTQLTVNGVAVDDLVKEQTIAAKPTKMSQLANDANFAKTTDTIAAAATADTADNLVGKSGVTAGTTGATGNVTISSNRGSGTIKIPQFTVNAQGVITSLVERTLTITTGCSECSVTSGCNNCSQCNVTSGCRNCRDCTNCDKCKDCVVCSYCGVGDCSQSP